VRRSLQPASEQRLAWLSRPELSPRLRPLPSPPSLPRAGGFLEPAARRAAARHPRARRAAARAELLAERGHLLEVEPLQPLSLALQRRLSLRLRLPLHLLDPRLCGGTARSDQLTRACLGRLLSPRVDEGDLLAPHLTHRRC